MALEFTVNRQVLIKTSGDAIVANSQQYLSAKFKFSSDWDGLHKIAHFRRKYPAETTERYVDVVLNDKGECAVPDSMMESTGNFTVGVYGQTVSTATGTANVVITCSEVSVHVAYAYLPENALPYTPLDGVVGQAYAKIASIYDNMSKITPVGENIEAIKNVYNHISDIQAINPHLTNIGVVASNINNVAAVGVDITSVNAVAGSIANVNTCADSSNLQKITLVGTNISAVNTVSAAIADVVSVSGNISAVSTVSGAMTNVNNVGNNITAVNAVSGNMPALLNVNSVKPEIAALGAIADAIKDVAFIKYSVYDVAQLKTQIQTIGANMASVINVSSNMAHILNTEDHLPEIIDAPVQAVLAKQWAIGEPTEPVEGSAKYWAHQSHADQIQSNMAESDTSKVEFVRNKHLKYLDSDASHRTVTDLEKAYWSSKQNHQTTLAGYGITDAYTKTQVDAFISAHTAVLENHESRITSNTNAVANHSTIIAGHTTTIADHESRITSNTNAVGNHATLIAGHTATLDNHEQRITLDSGVITNHTSQIGSLTAELATHKSDTVAHVTATEKATWDSKAEPTGKNFAAGEKTFSSSSTNVTVDIANGLNQYLSAATQITLPTLSGDGYSVTLMLLIGAASVTWGGAPVVWANDEAPEISEGKIDMVMLHWFGGKWRGCLAGSFAS